MISGSFYRGTTPTHTFTIPFEQEYVSDLKITYFQNKKQVFVKDINQVKISGRDINITLTQEETYLFEAGKEVLIQVKIKTKDNTVLNSDIIKMRVDASLNNEVI